MDSHTKARIWRKVFIGLFVLLVVIIIGGWASARYGNIPSKTLPTYSNQELQDIAEANELARRWIFNNVRDKGLFVYTFNPVTGELPNTNNAIRQLMASRILAEESSESEELLPLHRKNLDFLMEFWYQMDGDNGYVFYDSKSKLGANAMLLRTLVYSPLFDEYREEAEALAKGILTLQSEDGSFEPWYVEPSYGYDPDYLLTFYSGEALLALVEYYEKTGDEMVLEMAEKSADFYIDRYVTHLEENYYPAYVPWHTLAYNHLFKLTSEKKYADAIFVLNDKVLELQDTTNVVGRFYNPKTPQYGSPHSSSDAVYTEGLAYAYEVAREVGDNERVSAYREATLLGAENIQSLQYTRELDNNFAPETYIGAIRTREGSAWIRVDTTQHTVDAFTKILGVLGQEG